MNSKLSFKKNNNFVIVENSSKIKFYVQNLVILIATTYLCFNFQENPLLIGVLIFILLSIILPLNYVDYFFVSNEYFAIVYKRIFFLHFLNERKEFYYHDIKKITAILKHDRKTDWAAFMVNFNTTFVAISLNTIEVEMIDGTKKVIKTFIYKEAVLSLLNYIKSKSLIEIVIVIPSSKLI